MFRLDHWEFCRNRNCRDRESIIIIDDLSLSYQWLQGIQEDPAKMLTLRKVLLEESGAGDLWRMSDQRVIEQIARLLASGRLHVHRPIVLSEGGKSPDLDTEKLVPFPLSERRLRAPAASNRELSIDSPTFSPYLNPTAQAAALEAAAADGMPFCPQ
jgi:hypothetical protein